MDGEDGESRENGKGEEKKKREELRIKGKRGRLGCPSPQFIKSTRGIKHTLRVHSVDTCDPNPSLLDKSHLNQFILNMLLVLNFFLFQHLTQEGKPITANSFKWQT